MLSIALLAVAVSPARGVDVEVDTPLLCAAMTEQGLPVHPDSLSEEARFPGPDIYLVCLGSNFYIAGRREGKETSRACSKRVLSPEA
jgi:hypothetical protein